MDRAGWNYVDLNVKRKKEKYKKTHPHVLSLFVVILDNFGKPFFAHTPCMLMSLVIWLVIRRYE